jgi:hypothetical protein
MMEISIEDAKSQRKMPKAVPFVLANILLERYSTTAISGRQINSNKFE